MWPCNTCGQTFKQRAFLDKHRENQLAVKSVTSVTSLTPKPKPSTSASSVENAENMLKEDEEN